MAWGKTDQNGVADTAQPAQPAEPILHPVDRARTAFGNGDRFFQVQLVVNEVTVIHQRGKHPTENRMTETEGVAGLLGAIESIGWRLEHVGYSFREKESIKTLIGSREGRLGAGQTIGIYLLRRPGA